MRNVDDYAEFCLIPVVFEHLLFTQFEKDIHDYITSLSPRLQSYLSEYVEHQTNGQLVKKEEIDALASFTRNHAEQKRTQGKNAEQSFYVDDSEVVRAVQMICLFDEHSDNEPHRLQRFYKLGERIVRSLNKDNQYCTHEKISPDKLLEALNTFQTILKRYIESQQSLSRINQPAHNISKMMLEAFIEFRAKPACDCKSLRLYILSDKKNPDMFVTAMQEFEESNYRKIFCSDDFRIKLKSKMQPKILDDFKKKFDRLIEDELQIKVSHPKAVSTKNYSSFYKIQ